MKKILFIFLLAASLLAGTQRLLLIGDSNTKIYLYPYLSYMIPARCPDWGILASNPTGNMNGTTYVLTNWDALTAPYFADTTGLWVKYSSFIHDIEYPITATQFGKNLDTILTRFKDSVGSHIILASYPPILWPYDTTIVGVDDSANVYNDTLLAVANRVLGVGGYIYEDIYSYQKLYGDSIIRVSADGLHWTSAANATFALHTTNLLDSLWGGCQTRADNYDYRGSGIDNTDASLIAALSYNVDYGSAGLGAPELPRTNLWRGTTSTAWNTAANWSPAAVPTIDDTARFRGDSAAAGCILDVAASVARLYFDVSMDESFYQNGKRITTKHGAVFTAATASDTVSLDSALIVTGDGNLTFGAGPTYSIDVARNKNTLSGTGNLAGNTTVSIGATTCAASTKTTTIIGTGLTVSSFTTGTGALAMGTATLAVTGDFDIAGTVDDGTSTLNLIGTTVSTPTFNNQTFYDLNVSKQTNGVTFQDSVKVAGDFAILATNTAAVSWNGQQLVAAGDVTCAGSGTLNTGNGATFTSPNATFHLNTTLGAITGTSTAIRANATGLTLDFDKAAKFGQFIHANSAYKTTFTGTAADTFAGMAGGGYALINQTGSTNFSAKIKADTLDINAGAVTLAGAGDDSIGVLTVLGGLINVTTDTLRISNSMRGSTAGGITGDAATLLSFTLDGARIGLFPGDTIPGLMQLSGSAKIDSGGAINRLTMQSNGDTITWQHGKRFSFVSIDTTDFNGIDTTTGINVWLSSTATSRDTLAKLGAAVLLTPRYFKMGDCVWPTDTIDCRYTNGCISRGGNQ